MSSRADKDLQTDQFAELNERFYAGLDPAGYFRARLALIANTAANGWPTSAVAVERFRLPEQPAMVRELQDRLLAIESFMLYHHVAETAWLLFVAHERPQGCPRLAVARLRVNALHSEVKAYRDETELDRRLARIRTALGFDDGGELAPGASEEVFRTGLEGADLLLRELGNQLLVNSPLYNSAKHGMALDGGMARIGFTTGSPDPEKLDVYRDAMWLENLQYRDDEEQMTRTWTRTHVAVELDRLMALTGLAVDLINTIWRSGQVRFGKPEDGDDLPTVVKIDLPSVERVQQTAYERGHRIERISIDLHYTDARERRILLGGSVFPAESAASAE
jgi:hypothetical protein